MYTIDFVNCRVYKDKELIIFPKDKNGKNIIADRHWQLISYLAQCSHGSIVSSNELVSHFDRDWKDIQEDVSRFLKVIGNWSKVKEERIFCSVSKKGYRINKNNMFRVATIESFEADIFSFESNDLGYHGDASTDGITMTYAEPAPSLQTNPNGSSIVLPVFRLRCNATPPIRAYRNDRGRKEAFEKLREQLRDNRPIFVTGDGGIGKTEFVLWSMQELKKNGYESYQVDFQDTLENTILHLEFDNGQHTLTFDTPEERAKVINMKMAWLESQPDNVILLLDNFDAPSGDTYELLLEEGRLSSLYQRLMRMKMHFIFTTRNRGFTDEDPILIQSLPEDELLNMILETVQKHGDAIYYSADDIETLKKIVQQVESHTLTVDIIGRSLLTPGLTPERLLAALESDRYSEKEWVKTRSTYRVDRREKTILGHLMTVFSLVGLNELQKRLLCYATLFPRMGFSEIDLIENVRISDIVDTGTGICKESPETQLNEEFIGKLFANLYEVEELYKGAINSLVQNGWLKRKNNDISIHALIKVVVLECDETEPNWKHCGSFVSTVAASSMRLIVDGLSTKADYSRGSAYLNIIENTFTSIIPILSGTYAEICSLSDKMQAADDAFSGEKTILAVPKDVPPLTLSTILYAGASLADVYGKMYQASLLWNIYIKMTEEHNPNDVASIGYAYSNMASYCHNTREFEKGVRLHNLAIINYSKREDLWDALAEEHFKLGCLYLDYSLMDKGYDQLSIAKEILISHGISDSDQRFRSIIEMEKSHQSSVIHVSPVQDDYANDIHSGIDNRQWNDHNECYDQGLNAMVNGKPSLAIKLFLQAEKMILNVFPANDYRLLRVYTNLGVAYRMKKQYALAKEYLTKSKQIYDIYPERLSSGGACYFNLALCEQSLKDLITAKAHAWKAAAIYISMHVDDPSDTFHPEMMASIRLLHDLECEHDPQLKELYMGLSDEEKAVHRLEHMVFVKEQILGKGNVKMYNDYYELIQELIAANKHDYAIAQLNTLLTIEEKEHGANSKECIEIIMQKGHQWFCLEQWEKAFQEYVEACARLKIIEKSNVLTDKEDRIWVSKYMASALFNVGNLHLYHLHEEAYIERSFCAAASYIQDCIPSPDEEVIKTAISIYMQLFTLYTGLNGGTHSIENNTAVTTLDEGDIHTLIPVDKYFSCKDPIEAKKAEVALFKALKILLQVERENLWEDDKEKLLWLNRTLANTYYTHGRLVFDLLHDVEHGYMSFEHARAYISKCFPTEDEGIIDSAKEMFTQVIDILSILGMEEAVLARTKERDELLKS